MIKEQELLLSIIIPVHNSAPYLTKCLESLKITLQHNQVEVIIIDDASTDQSNEIIRDFAQFNERVRTISFVKNKGVGAVRNKGLSIAKGKYIWFVDSDDWIENDIFSELKSNITHNHDVIVLGFITRMDSIFRDKKKARIDNYPQIKEKESDYLKWFLLSLKGLIPTPWPYLFSRKFLIRKKIRFLENTSFEDVLFTTHVFTSTAKVGVISLLAYNYRIHFSSVTQSITKQRIDDCFTVHYTIKNILKGKKLYPKYKEEFNARLLAFGIKSCYDYYFKINRREKDEELVQLMKTIRKSELMSFKNLALLKKTGEEIQNNFGQKDSQQFMDSFHFLTNIKVYYVRTKLMSQMMNKYIATKFYLKRKCFKLD